MTTIAYDHINKTIAVDSLCTSDTVSCGNVKKWLMLKDGTLVFGVGALPSVLMFFDAIKNGQEADPANYNNADIIIVRDGKVYECFCPIPQEMKQSWAWGSGREFALGAMYTGCTADVAVKAAIKYDVRSGGKVHVFTTQR